MAFDSEGQAAYTLHETGNYTFSVEYDGDTYSESISITEETTYNVSIDTFTATINITSVSQSLYGTTLNVELDGTNIDTVTLDSSGQATYTAREAGLYKFTSSSSVSAGVSATTSGQSLNVSVSAIVTWANGSDAEIAAMVASAQAGDVDLTDYWTVGNERTVHLSAMTTGDVVGETQAEQDVVMVLMHAGGVPLSDGEECNFVVGQKNALSSGGYMNSSNTNSGSWGSCARRTWCNNVYYNALPEYFKNMLLTMKTKTPTTETGSAWQEVEDKIALPSVAQVWAASGAYMNANEFNGDLVQFDYYKTAANRIKKTGDSGSAYTWWERSPSTHGQGRYFCIVTTGGSNDAGIATDAFGVAPFGCI